MGETKASNGVSGNNAKGKASNSMKVKEVSVQELEKKLKEYAQGNPIYVAGIDFGVKERDDLEISNSNNAGASGDTDNTARNDYESGNGLIVASGTVTKSIETVLGPGVIAAVKGKKIEKDQAKDGEEQDKDEQTSRE